MEVPPTPLHTSRVLTEERELWDDVKVRLNTAMTHIYQRSHQGAAEHQYANTQYTVPWSFKRSHQGAAESLVQA